MKRMYYLLPGVALALVLALMPVLGCITIYEGLPESGTAPAQKTEEVSLPNIFQEQGFGFTIRYPADWIYIFDNEYTVIFSGMEGTPAFYSTVNIQNVASTKLGGSYTDLDSVVSDFKNQLASASQGKIYNEKTFIYPMRDGHELMGKQFTAEYYLQGTKFKQLQIVVPRSNEEFFHCWAYTSPIDQYDTYFAIAQAMLSSWVITTAP